MADTGPSWDSLPQSTRTMDEIMGGFVDLVTSARSATDLTSESVSRAFELDLQQDDDGDVGSYARLTPTRSYALGLHAAGTTGRAYFHLTFFSKDGDASSEPPPQELRLDNLAERLKQHGFHQKTQYGEHGSRLGEDFIRGDLKLQVMVKGHRVDDGSMLLTISSVVVS